jgi:hypothetical protein
MRNVVIFSVLKNTTFFKVIPLCIMYLQGFKGESFTLHGVKPALPYRVCPAVQCLPGEMLKCAVARPTAAPQRGAPLMRSEARPTAAPCKGAPLMR